MALTAEQHEERKHGVGGSDAPVIVLGEIYGKTVHDLWLEKTGRIAPVDLDGPDIRRGIRQEPVAAALYQEQTGQELVEIKKTIVHAKHPFMLATIDRLIKPGDDVLEIKCPRMTTFRKWQLEGIPEYVQIQGQHYCEVVSAKRVIFSVFCAEIDELLIVPVNRDEELIDLILDKETKFWNNVRDDVEPARIEGAKPLDLPPVGGELIRIESAEWQKAAQDLQEAQELKKEARDLEEEAKERIKNLMGNAEVAEGYGLRIYNRLQNGRITYDMKKLQRMNPSFDLVPYTKFGEPFRSFKPYFTKEYK